MESKKPTLLISLQPSTRRFNLARILLLPLKEEVDEVGEDIEGDEADRG